jgi:hypothetical protein
MYIIVIFAFLTSQAELKCSQIFLQIHSRMFRGNETVICYNQSLSTFLEFLMKAWAKKHNIILELKTN